MATATAQPRLADPWNDTAIIDRGGPRTNQALMAVGSAVALLTGAQWLVALLALQIVLGLTLGRRWCVACWIYFGLIQPRTGEGVLEDSRAPRFAFKIALSFTSAATLAFVAGLPAVGWVLTATVGAVAAFSALSGFCVGCWAWAKLHPDQACEICQMPEPAQAAA